ARGPPARQPAPGGRPLSSPCSVRTGVPEAGDPGAKCAAVTTRATASAGKRRDCPRRGGGKCRALPGGGPTGRGEPAPGGRPRFPWAGGGPPLRAGRPRPRAASSGLEGQGRPGRGRQWSAEAGERRGGEWGGGGKARQTVTWPQVRSHIACSDRVVRGGVEPPTFRSSGGLASSGESTADRLTRPYGVLALLEVQDHPHVSTAVVS